MSRKRRILIVTEATFSAIRQAMGYVYDIGTEDGSGDVSLSWGRSNERAKAIVDTAPLRDIHADSKALRNVLGAAVDNSCSCPGLDVYGESQGASEHKASGHCNDCWNATNYHELERVRALLAEMDKNL